MLKQACPVDSCTASLRVACWLMGFSSSLITIPSRPAPYHDAKSILLSFIGSRRSRLFAIGFYTEFETLGHRTLHLRSSAGPGWFAVCSKQTYPCQRIKHVKLIIWLPSDSTSALPLTQNDQHLPVSSFSYLCFPFQSFSSVSLVARPRDRSKAVDGARRCVPQLACLFCTKSESRNFDQFGILMNVVHILLMNIDEYCTFVMICSTVSLSFYSFTVTSFSSCFSIMPWVSNWVVGACVRRTSKQWQFKFELPWSHLAPNQVCKQQSKVMKFHEVTISKSSIYIYIHIYIYYIIYSQYVLERGPMDGAFIARCGGLASDGPKIGPDFATAPMVPSHADAPWFGHWFGHFTRRRCRDVTRCWLWS